MIYLHLYVLLLPRVLSHFIFCMCVCVCVCVCDLEQVVAHFGEVAASGGYYCACGADK